MGEDHGRDDEPDEVVHRTEWDLDDPKSLPSSVVRAVAAVEEVEMTEMTQLLSHVVDPDALVNVFASEQAGSDISVTFPLEGYEITVTDRGDILVRSPDAE